MLGLAALPTAWKVAGGLALVLLVIAGLAAGGAWAWHQGAAACQAGQAKAVAEAQQKADKLANDLIIAQAQAMATTEKVTTVYKDRIVHAPTTNSCGDSVRDASRGVLQLLRGSEASPASPAPH